MSEHIFVGVLHIAELWDFAECVAVCGDEDGIREVVGVLLGFQ